jgi:signal transduction histidine kinase
MAPTVDTHAREQARLAALQRTGLLDSPPEHLFDLITALAAKTLNVPVVLMSLVDADRQFFKSQCGLPPPWAERRETPLSHSFCQYVAMLGEALVVEDARQHPLVRENLAVSEIDVIAYAGMPLTTEDGFTLGSLCAIDTQPRRWTADELEILRGFAEQIMAEISFRSRMERLDADLGALRASETERRTEMRQIVHDLRTPLNAIYLGLSGLPAMGELNKDQRAYLELARKNATVLGKLVHQMIEVGDDEDKGANPRVPCLPHEMVNRALDQVATLAQSAGIRLQHGTLPPLPAISADGEDLTRVLVNLIANGVNFTPRGGSVSVSTSQESEHGIDVIRFSVTDTGIGIAPEDQSRIFREGVRLDEKADPRRSTGIGLAFCKRVVEEHGGVLRIESAAGEGSTFSLALPVDRGARSTNLAFGG